MAVYAYFKHESIDYYNYLSIKLIKRVSDTNSSSSFTIQMDNLNGMYATTFNKSDEILIYADKDVNPPTTKLFCGIIRDITFTGSPNEEKLTISGIGFVEGILMDSMVEPEVYNNAEVSTIVTDSFDKYTTGGITRTNVDVTSTTLTRIRFVNVSFDDLMRQCAELSGFFYYGDADKDLHFEEKETTSSGLTFDSTNIIGRTTFKDKRADYFNEIWVYGGKMNSEYEETFTANGGSAYTLSYRPTNTYVTVSGVIKKGAVFEMVTTPGSGQEYLVDYDGKRVIFTSGTEAGNNIPVSGTDEIYVKYGREMLVAKYGIDRNAVISNNNIRVGKSIIDQSITDPRQAENVVNSQLAQGILTQNEGSFAVDGVFVVTPGQTCIVNLPYHNINSDVFVILEAIYDFTPNKMLADTVLSLKVNKKTKDIVDTLKQLILDVKKLQAAEIREGDIVTRLETATGSFGFKVSEWIVKSWDIGSRFIMGHSVNGRLGAVTGTQPYLPGSASKVWTNIVSGGYV